MVKKRNRVSPPALPLPSPSYTVGIVCSGNTCRSPVTEAWLRQILAAKTTNLKCNIWSAGLMLGKERTVHEQPRSIAREMGLSAELLDSLRRHEARDLKKVVKRTDLLVWITDPAKINSKDGNELSRAERMRVKAKLLGATLLVIPEADLPWEAKEHHAPDNEVLELYRDQAISLQKWASIIYRFIP
jgi:hypothetical protein